MTRLQDQQVKQLINLLSALVVEQVETNRLLVELLTNHQQEDQDDDVPQRDLSGKPIRYV